MRDNTNKICAKRNLKLNSVSAFTETAKVLTLLENNLKEREIAPSEQLCSVCQAAVVLLYIKGKQATPSNRMVTPLKDLLDTPYIMCGTCKHHLYHVGHSFGMWWQ